MNANHFRVDYSGNVGLKDLFANLNTGDTTVLKFKLRKISSDQNSCTLQIVKVTPTGKPRITPLEGEEAEGTVTPSMMEPAAIVIGKQGAGAMSEGEY